MDPAGPYDQHRDPAVPHGGRFRDGLAVLLLAGALGTILHWDALTRPDRFHDNWRQTAHWLAPERQQFQPDDIFLHYGEFNRSPFANFMYQTLARTTGLDLFWGKFNAVLFFSLTALAIYVTAALMGGLLSGWLAAIIFMCFPCKLAIFVGGFMSGFSILFLCLTVLLIFSRRWWWVLPVQTVAFLTYPMVAIQCGVMLILDAWVHDRRHLLDADRWKRKLWPLMLAAGVCVILLYTKYIDRTHQFGHLVTRAEIGHRVEFTRAGRSLPLPTRPISRYFVRHWGGVFRVGVFVVAFVWLGRRMFRLPRGLYPLLVSSILLYYLSDVVLMRLYFPTRYVHRSLPLFLALAGGYWLSLILRPHLAGMGRALKSGPWRFAPYATVAGLLVAGIAEHGEKLVPPGDLPTYVYNKHELYDVLRDLPGRPLIAAHPRFASQLPIMTGKSVLVHRELSHPYWTSLWEVVVDRTRDFFRGYYARDAGTLREVIARQGIDYWVVDRTHFTSSYFKKGEYYMPPFRRWIRSHLRPRKGSLLRRVPSAYRLYNGRRYYVVSSEDLLRWLDERERGARGAFSGGEAPS